MQLTLPLCIFIAILPTASFQPSDNGTQIAATMAQIISTTVTTSSSIPAYIKNRLTCSVVNKTCMDLGPVYEDTYEYMDVCYPVYDDDGRVESYAACRHICKDYFKDGVGLNYQRRCEIHCSTFPDYCLLRVDETTATTPEQTVTPPRDPYSVEECCNATDYICQEDPLLTQNCGKMCYSKHVSPGEYRNASCKPACTSDDHIQLDKCDQYCPHYNDTCRIYNIVTLPHSTNTATTTTTEAPTTEFADFGLVIGIVVAVVILLVIIGGIAICCRRRVHQCKGRQGSATDGNIELGPPDQDPERADLMGKDSSETSSSTTTPDSSGSSGSSRTDVVELESLRTPNPK